MDIGKISESVLKRSVLKYVQQNNQSVQGSCHLLHEAEVGADCALFAVKEAGFKMGSATAVARGRHRMVVVEAMINACNNLICSGAEAFGVELSLFLPQALYESELRHMMEEASKYATAHQITILGGHTTVSAGLTETLVSVTALGYAAEAAEPVMKAGMDVVMTKWLGLQGTARLATERREQLLQRLPSRFVTEAAGFDRYMSIIPEARIALVEGAAGLHDVSGGGVFRALWELAEQARTGIRIELRRIPVKQETIEVCEAFGLNPYELLGGGALLIVTEDGETLVSKLAEADIHAAVIGKLTDNNDRVLITQGSDSIETRFLERPKTDEIDK